MAAFRLLSFTNAAGAVFFPHCLPCIRRRLWLRRAGDVQNFAYLRATGPCLLPLSVHLNQPTTGSKPFKYNSRPAAGCSGRSQW
jgi:hypothetical protein